MNATNRTTLTKKLPALLITSVAIGLVGFVLYHLDRTPRTDDAYVYADSINVVPEVSGRIISLPVRDNQEVHAGDVLFQIDPRAYQDALDQAKARLVALDRQIELTQRSVASQEFNAAAVRASVERSRASARQAEATLARMEPLLSMGYVSADEVDRARTTQKVAQAELSAQLLQAQQAAAAVSGVDALVAQREVIRAEMAIAALNLEHTTVLAPFGGRVVALKTSTGQYASAQKPIFTLIKSDQWYVVANFRETDLNAIRPGTPGTVYVMGDSGKSFHGTVDSVGYGVFPDDGGMVTEGFPRVNRSINWVHVSQRFPVKIAINDPDSTLFRVGASANVILNTGEIVAKDRD